MFFRFLKKYHKPIVAGFLICATLALYVPSARAQDITAVCETDPAVTNLTTQANPPTGASDAQAAGFICCAFQSSAGTSIVNTSILPGWLNGILTSSWIPIAGQIISAAFVGYMIVNMLLHRAPLPGPGAITRGPEGYALVGIGYGSDDAGAFLHFWEGEIQPDGSVIPIDPSGSYNYVLNGIPKKAANTELARTTHDQGGDDSGSPDTFVPKNKYAVGWTFVPSRTSGGRGWINQDTQNPKFPCFFQMFRKVDQTTGNLVGPILGWSGAGDPADNLSEIDPLTGQMKLRNYNGSCDERGYNGGADLKIVKMVSDLPDPSNGYVTNINTSKRYGKEKNFSGWYQFQGEPPIVDFPTDPPPSRRVIVGMRFELNDDADVGVSCLAFNTSGKITVRSLKSEDPGTDLGLPFDLQGPTPALSGSKTLYQNENSAFGSYGLTVPPGTDTLFPGYTCNLRLVDSSIDSNDPTSVIDTSGSTDCNSVLTGQLDAIKSEGADGTEFIIEFTKGACVPKSCTDVVAGGAVCGTFSNGCGECVPGDPDPAKRTGCLDCGTCTGAGEMCTPTGQCAAPLQVGCNISPASIFVGDTATFGVTVNNGTEPLNCAWQEASGGAINGKTSCAFSQVFTAAGVYDASVLVSDSSAPARTGSASCALTVQTIPPGCEGGPPAMGGVPAGGATGVSCPRPIVPRYEVCEAYKVVTRYGIPLFAITTLLAGLYLMVSMGRPERVTRGKQVFGASIAGLLIIILAKPLLVTMLTFLGFQVFLCGQPIP